jgi:hypothetical protein
MSWHPIETAPRGTPILVTDGETIVVCERGECAGKDWMDSVGFGGYEWDWYIEWDRLTHWMPLPDQPRKET